jgi:hypothetical protein
MALSNQEKEHIGLAITRQLSHTSYACSSLQPLNGGTTNFLFRGVLSQPLSDGRETIVVKHSRGYVSENRNFALNISRCVVFTSSPVECMLRNAAL